MAKFCEVLQWGKFKRGKIASKIHEFHGGMGSATYRVGSLIMAGECVPQDLLLDAADEVADVKGGRVLASMLKGWARDAKTLDGLHGSLSDVDGMGPCCVKRNKKGRCTLWAQKRFVLDGQFGGKCLRTKRRKG